MNYSEDRAQGQQELAFYNHRVSGVRSDFL